MPIFDKHSILATLRQRPSVSLELGCGSTKRDPGAIGVDAQDLPGVDLVGDVFDALAALPAGSVDSVSSFHFFEHVEDLPGLLAAIARVVKQGGRLRVVTPHFSNPYFHSDYTHRRTFGLYTFCYLARSALFARQVPTYGAELQFEVEHVRLGFRSTRPFYVRHAIKRTQGVVFNATRWLQEYWEENLCWSFPAYEVDYLLRRL